MGTDSAPDGGQKGAFLPRPSGGRGGIRGPLAILGLGRLSPSKAARARQGFRRPRPDHGAGSAPRHQRRAGAAGRRRSRTIRGARTQLEPSMAAASSGPPWPRERCESGRIGRSRKPLSRLRLRGFESHSLRECRKGSPEASGAGDLGPFVAQGRLWYIHVPAALAPSVVQGEMTEWSKVHAWKACVLVRVPWVRIPLSPLPLQR